MRSNTSFFLDVLACLCLDVLDGIALDWIWPVVWACEALQGLSITDVAEP